jgi:serine/threonine-protein kinase HipA
MGHLTHDGFEWRWKPIDSSGPPLIRQTTPGKLPPFIVSLLPEGWLENVTHVLKPAGASGYEALPIVEG